MHLLLSIALLSETASAKWLIIEEGGATLSHNTLDGALSGLGETFDVKTANAVSKITADVLFADYEAVYIGVSNNGNQLPDADVAALIRPGGVVEAYVDLGGVLLVHGAHNDPSNFSGPGGSTFLSAAGGAASYDDAPTFTDLDHEFTIGTFAGGALNNSDIASWFSTCHGAVTSPPGWIPSAGVNLGTNPIDGQWNEIIKSPASKKPAMIEYTFGCGYVLMDLMTFDWDGNPAREALVMEAAAYIQGIQTNFPFCNVDSDEDGLLNNEDNCDNDPNPLQEDTDGDGVGDVCDPCDHDDGPDGDGDGLPDDCDPCPDSYLNDTDDDGTCDTDDICPGHDDFADEDGDTLPDGCDNCPQDPLGADDDDGDLACNSTDACPGSDDYADRDIDGVADGCDICPDDADPKQKEADGDGFGAACDCDDGNAAIHPDAAELCDLVDNDCDGIVDGPGAIGDLQWFVDADGDGQGAPGTLVNGCEQPDNTAANNDDCDDTNPLVFVGAEEFCDTPDARIDSDCDGDPSNGLECELAVVDENPAPPPTSCGSCAAAGGDPGATLAGLAAVVGMLLKRRRA